MAVGLKIDIAKFRRDLNATVDAIGAGAKRGMHDALDDWLRESRDIAPLDKGTLRQNIHQDNVIQNGLNIEGGLVANAVESSPGWPRFNYAYYLHEVKGDIKRPTTPGTVAKFLDEPAREHERRWVKMIENEINEEVKRKGW